MRVIACADVFGAGYIGVGFVPGHEGQAQFVDPGPIGLRANDLPPVTFFSYDLHDRAHQGLVTKLRGIVRRFAHIVGGQIDHGPFAPFPGGDLGGCRDGECGQSQGGDELSHIRVILCKYRKFP